MSGTVTTIASGRAPGQVIAAIIAGDESDLRQLAMLLAPYLAECKAPESDGWMCSREAAEYAGTTINSLHRAMAAREISSSRRCAAAGRGSGGSTSTRGVAASDRAGERHERSP